MRAEESFAQQHTIGVRFDTHYMTFANDLLTIQQMLFMFTPSNK
jgi:hypothetical protein